MKKSFKSIKELTDYLNEKIRQAMDEVGETAWRHMYDYVADEMNSRPENEDVYKRTWEYLNSIDKITAEIKNGEVVVEIFYNTDKIDPYIYLNKPFNAHADLSMNDVSSAIPLWMDYGNYNRSTGLPNRIHEHEPVGGIINLKEWVEKNLRKELKVELRKQGIQTK